MNGREPWTRGRLDGIEADNEHAARIVSEIISSAKLKPLRVPAADDDYDVVLSGLVTNVRLLVGEVRAQVADVERLRAWNEQLNAALERYTLAHHYPVHPGHPAFQLMISTDVREQALRALESKDAP